MAPTLAPATAGLPSSLLARATDTTKQLFARYYYCDNYGDGYYYNNCGNSPWYNYGRWILLGCLIGLAIIVFFLFSCVSARRRRRAGRQPFMGTGWAAYNVQPGTGGAAYGNNPNYYQPGPMQQPQGAAPTYSQAPQQGYYGAGGVQSQQTTGTEMQQPAGTYQRAGEEVYGAPNGPPPGKR